ncbi:MAG TPA: hypothetical protein VEG39_08370 [Clostridia bacterium]|nr:hypothetical protein [Clostridia bacterium]
MNGVILLQRYKPKFNYCSTEVFDRLLPWTEDMPAVCKLDEKS